MNETSAFEEFEKKTNFTRRRNLLPVWIKIFVWFFLIGGSVTALFLGIGPFVREFKMSIYGIQATHVYTLYGLITSCLIIYKGIVAYGLWFEQKWAPQAAIVDAVIGIAVCIIMMIIPFILPDNNFFTLRLELIPLYFYLVKMREIKQLWENL
ncbi:hypothetical protein SAMN05421856_10722 [Chryseobacterium taichungense]|uniref:Uncharacterized protein n=1 Tax=Chryseobacterium taichungense TaxID=295069 RepID=A0A1H8BH16_9FLAO|nr:hypothetical protein [Chryseobacterium taichungense]SEM82181.1 hypothetical protein SAMN05421856_10722 [Chryseobacterium taichungense]